MSLARSSAADWNRIAGRLARGAGLSPDDLRCVLAGLKRDDQRESFDAALAQWLEVDDAATTAGTTVVAEIPPPTARPAPELRIAHDAAGDHGERIRALRTELLLRRRSGADDGALAVLSAGAGEGRSRLAAELAIALSQAGAPTLLVDADLRRPRQQELFGADADAGLAEALDSTGAAHLQGVHDLPQLALVTAGAPPRDPLERLSRPRFAALLAGWSRQFQHIVVDTPPAAACFDALAVALRCGSALVVCRAGHARVDALRELLRRLELTPARVLGSVVTRF